MTEHSDLTPQGGGSNQGWADAREARLFKTRFPLFRWRTKRNDICPGYEQENFVIPCPTCGSTNLRLRAIIPHDARFVSCHFDCEGCGRKNFGISIGETSELIENGGAPIVCLYTD